MDVRLSAETLLPGRRPRTRVSGLPPHLLAQSARRLRIVALQYAFVFFMSDPLLAILFADERAVFLASPLRWAPATLSITTALIVAGLTYSRRIAVEVVLDTGLLFEVVGSFGIAAAQYLHPSRYAAGPPWAGLSWVAVWMIGFTVVIPSQPRRPSSWVKRSSQPDSHTSARGVHAPAARSCARNARTSARSAAARGGRSVGGGTSAGSRTIVSVTASILRHSHRGGSSDRVTRRR